MIHTPWGYSIDEDVIPPIIDVETFRTLYPNMSSTDEAVAMVLDAASAAIRDYCGWHVSPTLSCHFIGDGEGELLVLPAMSVVEITKLEVKGNPVNYEWRPSGLVRLTCGRFPDSWRSVECDYEAGFESASVAQVVGQIASNALVAAPGVASERAGNVSIDYNKTGDGITGGVSLLSRDYATLAPYKLARAW